MKMRMVSLLLVSSLAIGLTVGCTSKSTPTAPSTQTQSPQSNQNTPDSQPQPVETGSSAYNVDNIETRTFKISTSAKSATLEIPGYGAAIKYFCDEVESRSGGKIKMDIYLDAQLGGSADEMIGGCTTGAFEFITLNQGSWGDFTDGFMPFNIPFLFSQKEVAYQFMDGEQGKAIRDKIIADTDVRILCFYDMGYRHLTNNRKPVQTADDIKGLKVRTQADPYQMAPFSAMGGAVTTVAYSELYSALQQGLIDSQENPLSNIVINKYYEVQKYMTLTGHTYSLTTMAISEKVWQSLSPDLQALMEEVAADAVALCREGLSNSEKADLTTLEGVMEVYVPSDVDRQTFVDACKPVWDDIRNSIGADRFDAMISEVERINASL